MKYKVVLVRKLVEIDDPEYKSAMNDNEYYIIDRKSFDNYVLLVTNPTGYELKYPGSLTKK